MYANRITEYVQGGRDEMDLELARLVIAALGGAAAKEIYSFVIKLFRENRADKRQSSQIAGAERKAHRDEDRDIIKILRESHETIAELQKTAIQINRDAAKFQAIAEWRGVELERQGKEIDRQEQEISSLRVQMQADKESCRAELEQHHAEIERLTELVQKLEGRELDQ